MKKILLKNFEALCTKAFRSQTRIIFDSENQKWSEAGDTLRIKSDFDTIKFAYNPNTVTLSSNTAEITFARVRYVVIRTPSVLGEVYDIVCGDSPLKPYTIIIQKK